MGAPAKTTEAHRSIIRVILKIPEGKVATYGQIAKLAGNPRAARQVVWCLHSSSKKEKLPWHRVVNAKGQIALPVGKGYSRQKILLRREGIEVSDFGRVKLDQYQWVTTVNTF